MASMSPDNLCKCWKKTSPKLCHLSSSLAACLQLTAADFVPYLDQRSLFGTISFIKKFKFELK